MSPTRAEIANQICVEFKKETGKPPLYKPAYRTGGWQSEDGLKGVLVAQERAFIQHTREQVDKWVVNARKRPDWPDSPVKRSGLKVNLTKRQTELVFREGQIFLGNPRTSVMKRAGLTPKTLTNARNYLIDESND